MNSEFGIAGYAVEKESLVNEMKDGRLEAIRTLAAFTNAQGIFKVSFVPLKCALPLYVNDP